MANPQRVKKVPLRGLGVVAGVLVALFMGLWVWFGWRIEPEAGEFAVLMRKTGKDLPSDCILAPGPEYKGIQEAVLPEGRYFRNPFVWDWQYFRATDIAAGRFGVLIRKDGKPLPPGEIIARDGTSKGIVPEVLGTGRHRINPYAYDLRLYDDIRIRPGYVGVVTALVGADVFAETQPQLEERGFLVAEGSKGVQQKILKEGTHRLNPFLYAVSLVNTQSQRFELSGNDAITFLTLDGFVVTAEGTLEFNLEEDKVALLTQEVGDMDDILQKLILPSARGFSRIEGSKKMATEFIVGKSRQDFQDKLEAYLREICAPRGISLNSVLIRDIFAPQSIAGIVRDRELAVQESRKIEQQIVQAESQAELGRQKALAAQNSAVVMEQTAQIQARIAAEQRKAEQTIAAQAKLDVAKVAYEAALRTAEAKMTAAEAERRVIEARTKAFADVLRQEVSIYGNEADYVRMKLYEKTAPRVQSILATPEADAPFGLPLGVQSTPAVPTPAAPVQSTPAPVQSVPATPAAPVQP